jgi:ribosomal protein S18 acetylase RimI-like enzyme
MATDNKNLTFRQLDEQEENPFELLLLADPSKELIEKYLKSSLIFVAEQNKEIIGTVVLQSLSESIAEIKNIAVLPEQQGQGIGTYLIENIITVANREGFKSILIGTANSSIGQIYLYQKLGFEITEIRNNFFIDNYSEPIYENGIQAKDMIILTQEL